MKASSEGGEPRKMEPKTRYPNQLQLLLSHQSLFLHVICVILLAIPKLPHIKNVVFDAFPDSNIPEVYVTLLE